ncbi:MAG: TonB-dependent receptor [Vicinamibacteraceae bacterium]|nr:TonB-dependent receptor [Vicinamibacteraceae bacterium]
MAVRPSVRRGITTLAALGVVLVCLSTALAQVIYGTVLGTVSDTSGAPVPGAEVRVISLSTNEMRSTISGNAGTYSIPNLPPGPYRIEVELPGFKQFVRTDVPVQTDITTRVDVVLEVGDVSETVSVSGEAPLVQTDSSSLGAVVPLEAVEKIPLSGRNVNNLLTLVPGVVAQGGTYGNLASNQAGGARTNAIGFGNYAIGGGFGNQSSFYVDGVPANAPASNLNAYVPVQDVVQEFKVVTNNVSAEYGSYAGGVVNLTTKSGGNTFNGTLYEYFRDDALNEQGFFSKRLGLAKPPMDQNQYGGTLGGPLWKNRTFFFVGAERQQFDTASLSQTTVPTAEMRNGDFSAAGLAPIYDQSRPGNPQFQCNGVLNVICPDRLDPVALALLNRSYPLPNRPGLVNNYVVQMDIGSINNQINARVDHRFSDTNTMFVRYGYWKAQSKAYDAWGLGTQGQGKTGIISKQAIVGDTHTLNSTTFLDMRLSFLSAFQHEYPVSTGVDLGQFGAGWAGIESQLARPPNWPQLGFNGSAGVSAISGSNGVGSQLYWQHYITTASASLTKVLGKHLVKVGGMMRWTQWNAEANNGPINLTFDPIATSQASGVGGHSMASMLLGLPLSSSTTYIGSTNARLSPFGFFIDDTYQVNNRLTLTLGLRWDQPGEFVEKDRYDTVFLPDQASPLGSFVNPATGERQTLMGNVALVESDAWPSKYENDLHWKAFSPRVGFAYRLTDRTVFRGGYGISYPPQTLSQDGPALSAINAASTAVSNTFQVQTGSPSSILTTVANPLPFGINQPPRRNVNDEFFYGKLIVAKTPGDPLAIVHQWNFAVEQQIGTHGALSVAYAGSKGRNLLLQGFATVSNVNLNQLEDQYLALGSAALLRQVPNPFFGIITNPGTVMSQPTVAAGLLLRPYPQYDRVLQLDPHEGKSDYHSMQVAFRRRFAGAGFVTVAYTWSKLKANTDSVTAFLDEGFIFGGMVQNNRDLESEYSISAYDVPHNLSIGYTLELPFGQGKRFLSNASGIVNALVSGWRVNGITTYRSGPPLGITQVRAGTALSQMGGGGGYFGAQGVFMRPDKVAGCDTSVSGSRTDRIDQGWFNTACFTAVPFTDVRFGNAPRIDGDIRLDALYNWDASIGKQFNLPGNMNMLVTAEVYNLFNRTRFAAPGNQVGTPLFGKVTAQVNQPRAIQLGVRLNF